MKRTDLVKVNKVSHEELVDKFLNKLCSDAIYNSNYSFEVPCETLEDNTTLKAEEVRHFATVYDLDFVGSMGNSKESVVGVISFGF